MKYLGQTDYDHPKPPSEQGFLPAKGVLLCNLGTPDAPDAGALRRYLREFLSDPRVVEVPRLIWWLILNLVILRIRPSRSAKLYKEIWTEEGSPLMTISNAQKSGLQDKLDRTYGEGRVQVALGMCYGNPSIESALAELAENNVRDITVLPLYPQYCGASVGSVFDVVARALKKTRWVPKLQFISGYHTNSAWLEALQNSIQEDVEKHGMPEKILFSYHGTPEKYLRHGDPYHCFCHQTTRMVREKMGFSEDQAMTTFQSRFGREPWLQPYTDETLKALAGEGLKNVAIVCPGFSADCLETIEEIEIQNRECFLNAGGETFRYIKALNERSDHVDAMHDVIRRFLSD